MTAHNWPDVALAIVVFAFLAFVVWMRYRSEE